MSKQNENRNLISDKFPAVGNIPEAQAPFYFGTAQPMPPRARIARILSGQPIDRPAYSAWGHVMNLDDRIASAFARATIDLENLFQFDFIKLMSNPFYMLEDMGITILAPSRYDELVRRDSDRLPIRIPEDWTRIPFPAVGKGALAREVEAVKRVADYYQGQVPILPTVFTPLNWVQYLAVSSGKIEEECSLHGSHTPYLENYMTKNEPYIRPVLEQFCEITIDFMQALLDAGADGFFYCSEHVDPFWSCREAFDSFEGDYDRRILDSAASRSFLTIMHICGRSGLCPEWITDYPISGISWEDQSPDNPSMADMRALTDKILVGGLDHHTDLKGTDEDAIRRTITEKLKDAVSAAGDRLIFSGGCAWEIEDTCRFGLWRDLMNGR